MLIMEVPSGSLLGQILLRNESLSFVFSALRGAVLYLWQQIARHGSKHRWHHR